MTDQRTGPDAAPAQMPFKREMVGRKPLHIFQGGFSGRWYATASYDVLADGRFVARRKEDITEQIEAIIKAALRIDEALAREATDDR